MPKRFRLTRRLPIAMTEDGCRRQKRFAAVARPDQGEVPFFLFGHVDPVIDAETPGHRLRLFTQAPEAHKA